MHAKSLAMVTIIDDDPAHTYPTCIRSAFGERKKKWGGDSDRFQQKTKTTLFFGW